jgi:serine/threonine-protein kinase
MFWGGASWVLYLGLEPHIRKVWPHTLIGWTRVLSGRWRDPMVGRDLLVGFSAGLCMTLVEPLTAFISEALGFPIKARFIDNLEPLNSLPLALGLVLGRLRFAITLILVSFLLLSLLRSLFRSKVAAIAACLLIGGLGIPQAGTLGGPLIDVAIGFLKISLWLVVAVRFGVLAAIAMQALHMLTMTFPMTTELSLWYAQPTLVLLFLLLVLSLHAARSAQGASSPGAQRAP